MPLAVSVGNAHVKVQVAHCTPSSVVADASNAVERQAIGASGEHTNDACGAVVLLGPVNAMRGMRVSAAPASVPKGVANTVMSSAGTDKAGAVTTNSARPSVPRSEEGPA